MVILGADLHKRRHTVVAVDEHGRKLDERTVSGARPRVTSSSAAGRSAGPSGAGRWRTAATCRAASSPTWSGGRGGRPGAPEAHGRGPAVGARARQERPHRRARGGPGRPARAGPAGRPARRSRARGAPARRPPRGPRGRADPRPAPPLAPRLDLARGAARPRRSTAPHVLDDARGAARRPRRAPSPASPGTWSRAIRELTPASTPSSASSSRSWPIAPAPARARPAAAPSPPPSSIGETADIGRFRSTAAFARHNGTAPVPVWSGNSSRPPPEPRRQPPAQRGDPSHRHHPDAHRRTRPGLPRAPTGAGRHARPRRSGPSGAASATRSFAGCATMTHFERPARTPGDGRLT